jgi:hypothetical protein
MCGGHFKFWPIQSKIKLVLYLTYINQHKKPIFAGCLVAILHFSEFVQKNGWA